MALINTTTTGVLGTTLYGDGAGSLTVQKDGVTQGIFGNIPVFSVTRSADQSVTQNAYTKVNFDTKNFDTNNNYDATTNYRFTPTVAGYYLFYVTFFNNPAGAGQYVTYVRKNGSNYGPAGNLVNGNAVGGGSTVSATALIYANGTTDYFDTAVYASTASPTIQASSTFFGYLVKAA